MTDQAHGDGLAAELTALSAYLRTPEHSLWTRIAAQIDEARPSRRSRTRLVLVTVAALVILLVAIVSITPAREAVADLFGIGSTEISRVGDARADDATPSLDSTGDEDSLRRSLAAAHLRLPDTDLVGPPREWHVARRGETVVAYDDVVFGQRDEGRVPALKRVPESGGIVPVAIGREAGVWIEGPHTRTIDGRTVHSESALLWVDDGLELRLEGNRPLEELLAIARSVRPIR